MEYYARFNSTDFTIIELPEINDSSREVTFSDLVIDFRGYAETLLPIQYQEIKVIMIDEALAETELFTGYVDIIDLPEFTSNDTPFFLTISLLSPYAYAAKRTISAEIANDDLATAVETILAPLLTDDFTIETNELSTTKKISIILQMETIEKTMNYLANTYDFIWYIDKDKKIYLKDIDETKAQEPQITIDSDNKCYLKSIKPYKSVVDYANQINIKNIYLISKLELYLGDAFTIPANSYYEFEHPFSISINTASKITDFSTESPVEGEYIFYITGVANSVMYEEYITYRTSPTKRLVYSSGISIEGDSEDEIFSLVRSDKDSTLIKGFNLNLDYDLVVQPTMGSSAGPTCLILASQIKPYKSVYYDQVEIEDIKSKINTSGIIEKVINGNGKYFTEDNLFEFGTSLFKKNSSVTNHIQATFKGRNNDTAFMTYIDNLAITNIMSIDLPDFLINGNFLITDVTKKYDKETISININARNFDLNENFNDIFRENLEELEEDIVESTLTNYSKDKKIVLSRDIYVNGELVNK